MTSLKPYSTKGKTVNQDQIKAFREWWMSRTPNPNSGLSDIEQAFVAGWKAAHRDPDLCLRCGSSPVPITSHLCEECI